MCEEPELTFDMLHIRKPKRGTCLRCFTNPTQGVLQIQVLDIQNPKTSQVSLTTSLCMGCLELVYRSLATSLTQPVIFGDTCPRCQKERPIIGRVMLSAKKQIAKGAAATDGKNYNPRYKSIANSTYKYCESCAVYTYRNMVQLRDSLLEEGAPDRVEN